MPWWGTTFAPLPLRCRKKPTWSMMRGGCRFMPKHIGPCKPKGR